MPGRSGRLVGHTLNGYVRISLGGLGVHYAHRLAWLFMTGSMPEGSIDHVDGDRANNAWRNLRLASPSQNSANARRPSNNTTGRKGVTVFRGLYRAQISVRGDRVWLGDFPSLDAAAIAYASAARLAFGQFARVE